MTKPQQAPTLEQIPASKLYVMADDSDRIRTWTPPQGSEASEAWGRDRDE